MRQVSTFALKMIGDYFAQARFDSMKTFVKAACLELKPTFPSVNRSGARRLANLFKRTPQAPVVIAKKLQLILSALRKCRCDGRHAPAALCDRPERR
jgi:hypothetical protein